MWNKSFTIFLVLIMTLLPGLVACSRIDICEEKMHAIEGEYSFLHHTDPILQDGGPFTARVLKAGDQWVFSFTLPISPKTGDLYYHQFEQSVTWSPELNDYLFGNLSESDCELFRANYVITHHTSNRVYKNRITMYRFYQDEDNTQMIGSLIWDKL